MDRWLGDGGMPLLSGIGAGLTAYGVDGEDLGWVTGEFTPTALACNPHGTVQAGVHAVVLDAAMNFAINSALVGKDRTRGTLELKCETMRPALLDSTYVVRGDVTRMAKQVAFAEGTLKDHEGVLISRATGTFLLYRDG
jgi:acyl-coenzyme A thioesterase PaaI-like protein